MIVAIKRDRSIIQQNERERVKTFDEHNIIELKNLEVNNNNKILTQPMCDMIDDDTLNKIKLVEIKRELKKRDLLTVENKYILLEKI